MSKTNIIGSCEVTINYALKSISKLEVKNKQGLEGEFREWIKDIDRNNKKYDVLFINKIE